MTNTAEIINLQRPVVKADLDNGYTRIANELTEALMANAAKLSGREFQIIHAIIYKTFRFHKVSDWITNTQLSDLTGIDQSKISGLKKSLINKKIICVSGKEIGINTTVSEWANYPNKGKEEITPKRVSDYPNKGNELPENGYKITPKRVTHKKETITKETYTKEREVFPGICLPENLPLESVKNFIADRKERKQKMTEHSVKLFITECQKLSADGHCVEKAINTAILNSWKTVYPPRPEKFKPQPQPDMPSWEDVL